MLFNDYRYIYDTNEPPNEIGVEFVVEWKNETIPDGPNAGLPGFRVLYADIPGNSWNANRLQKFREQANLLFQRRTPLTDLPADDPDRLADPALPYRYWDGNDIVDAPSVVEHLEWTGSSLMFSIRRNV